MKVKPDYEVASSKACTMAAKHGKRYGVYNCPHCRYYHFTSKLEKEHHYDNLIYITP